MLARGILKRGLKHTPLVIPDLPYDYGELEPYISADITRTHLHDHHQVFIGQYNDLLEQLIDENEKGYNRDINTFQYLSEQIRFYNGVHTNHTLWWEFLANPNKQGGTLPGEKSALRQHINREFGNIENMIQKFNETAVAVPGSGWGWLALNPKTNGLSLETSGEQNTMIDRGLVPLIGIDVWEHAYYLDYQHQRAKYLENVWNIINWNVVESRYAKATAN